MLLRAVAYTSVWMCMCAYIHTYLEKSVHFLNHSSLIRRQVNNTVGSVEQREMEFGCHGLHMGVTAGYHTTGCVLAQSM